MKHFLLAKGLLAHKPYRILPRDVYFFKSTTRAKVYLEVGHMNDLSILVAGGEGDHSGPSAPHLIPGEDELTSSGVHVRLGLQPARQAAATGTRRTEHQIS